MAGTAYAYDAFLDRELEAREVAAEHASMRFDDLMTGEYSPYIAENAAEAIDNNLPAFAKVCAAMEEGDFLTAGQLLHALTEGYWMERAKEDSK